jgi:hypothetical protein
MRHSNTPTPLIARKTTYKGIPMRSRTEALYAAAMDKANVQWMYEPRAFADENAQYLPDFAFSLFCRPVFLEVKGHLEPGEVGDVQRKMQVIWASMPEAVLTIWEGWPMVNRWWGFSKLGWYEDLDLGPNLDDEVA